MGGPRTWVTCTRAGIYAQTTSFTSKRKITAGIIFFTSQSQFNSLIAIRIQHDDLRNQIELFDLGTASIYELHVVRADLSFTIGCGEPDRAAP
jgi:hypothetical protein